MARNRGTNRISAPLLLAAHVLLAGGCGLFEPIQLTVRIRGTTITQPDNTLPGILERVSQAHPDNPDLDLAKKTISNISNPSPELTILLETMLLEAANRNDTGQVSLLLAGATTVAQHWSSGRPSELTTITSLGEQTRSFKATENVVHPYLDGIASIYVRIAEAPDTDSANLLKALGSLAGLRSPQTVLAALPAFELAPSGLGLTVAARVLESFSRMSEAERLVFARALTAAANSPETLVAVERVALFLTNLSSAQDNRQGLLESVSALLQRPDVRSPAAWLALIMNEIVVRGVLSENRSTPLPWLNAADHNPWIEWEPHRGARSYAATLVHKDTTESCRLTGLATARLNLSACPGIALADAESYFLRIEARGADGSVLNRIHQGYEFQADWTAPAIGLRVLSSVPGVGESNGNVRMELTLSDTLGTPSAQCGMDGMIPIGCENPVIFANQNGPHRGPGGGARLRPERAVGAVSLADRSGSGKRRCALPRARRSAAPHGGRTTHPEMELGARRRQLSGGNRQRRGARPRLQPELVCHRTPGRHLRL